MHSSQLLIYTESFILNKGLEFIFKKMRGITVVATVENTTEFDEYIESKEIEIVLVSSTIFNSQNHIIEIYKTKKNLYWGILETNNDNLDGFYNFDIKLFVADGEKETLRKMNIFLNKLNELQDNSQIETELSKREKEILKQVALGLTNNKIAEKLFISQHTVVTHRKKITSKLGIKTISGLTVYALLNNLIEINDVEVLN